MPKAQSSEKILRVRLVRSPIGYTKDQRATARALGLRRLHQTVEHKDTPTLRGMIQKIVHLVQVEE
jgi:large subunit ribosomal protein L30